LRSCGLAVLLSKNSAAVEEMPEVEGKGNIKCQSPKFKWKYGTLE
jgi:hypothetical protein